MIGRHGSCRKGFTLIELLVVVAIIGLLSSIILSSLSSARESGMIAKRISAAKEIQNALEVYYLNNKEYPNTSGNWYTACTITPGTTKTANWIPGLAPTYIASLPSDPEQESGGVNGACCFLYRSNKTDYKLLFAYGCDARMGTGVYSRDTNKTFRDPSHLRDSPNSSDCTVDGNPYSVYTWAIYSSCVSAAW